MSYRKTAAALIAVAALATGCATPQREPVAGTYPAYPQSQDRVRYGYVEAVDVVQPETRNTTGVGAIGGAVAGGALGNQVGSGSGRTAATIGGAVVGAMVGNEVEKRVRSDNRTGAVYRFRVRMDDGSYQTFTQEVHYGIRAGDRVRVENGNVFAI